MQVTAELPRLEEKDIEVELANGVWLPEAKRKPRRRIRIASDLLGRVAFLKCSLRPLYGYEPRQKLMHGRP